MVHVRDLGDDHYNGLAIVTVGVASERTHTAKKPNKKQTDKQTFFLVNSFEPYIAFTKDIESSFTTICITYIKITTF